MSNSDCSDSWDSTANEVASPYCTMSMHDAHGLMQMILKLSDCE